MNAAWTEIEPNKKWRRNDGAVAFCAPVNSAKKTWVSKGPQGQRRRTDHNRNTVKYLTAENAMRAADRDWPEGRG